MPIRKKEPIDPERQLMIKTKTCQRMIKEVNYYHKEVKENEAKLAKMKEDDRDPYDIKKFEEVLGESYMMVPDSKKRLKVALEDLTDFMNSPEAPEQQSGEWFDKAKALLEEQELSAKATDTNDAKEEAKTDLSDLKEGEAF